MRAAAEVGELALGVDADGRDGLAGLLRRRDEVFDELDLERLVEPGRQVAGRAAGCAGPEHGQRLVDRDLEASDGFVLGDDLGHLLLDARQVGVGDRLRQEEVVVEAVLDGRPDGVLGARPEAQDRLGHDVAGRVADDVEALGAGRRDDGDLVALVEGGVQVDEALDRRALDACAMGRDGGFRQSRPDRLRGVERGRAVGEFERGAVGKGDVEGHAAPVLCFAPAHLAGAVDRESVAQCIDELHSSDLPPDFGNLKVADGVLIDSLTGAVASPRIVT